MDIYLFTDFGLTGPYVGEMHGVLARQAPGHAIIDLMHDAPVRDPKRAGYLLAALAAAIPAPALFVAVVDPGVGGDRPAAVVRAGGHVFVGPGNGLFEMLLRRHGNAAVEHITWLPDRLSPSFHGRDLFAPAAARLAIGAAVDTEPVASPDWRRPDWPVDWPEVIYIDGFGNAVTGCRAATWPVNAGLEIDGRTLARARTFSDVVPGQAFFYSNAHGLIEVAVNGGRADQDLSLAIGTPLRSVAERR